MTRFIASAWRGRNGSERDQRPARPDGSEGYGRSHRCDRGCGRARLRWAVGCGARAPSGRAPSPTVQTDGGLMTLTELVSTARDSLTVKRVFAEPLEKEGVTVIAAASIRGA